MHVIVYIYMSFFKNVCVCVCICVCMRVAVYVCLGVCKCVCASVQVNLPQGGHQSSTAVLMLE